MIFPFYQEITYADPLVIFHSFSSEFGAVWLDSARLVNDYGRYSFIGIDPFLILKSKNGSIQLNNETLVDNPFSILEEKLNHYPLDFHKDLPPFQGGAIGYFSYDLCHHLESLPKILDDMQFPDLILGFYDLVIAFDHEIKKAWIFSSGYPEKNSFLREERAKQRCEWLKNKIQKREKIPALTQSVCDDKDIHSNFSSHTYELAVQKVIDYILAGDIFEANISQRFKTILPEGLSTFELYRRLRAINAAPFAAYLNFGDTVIASASPERFIKLASREVETRPIKGTRPRGKTELEDQLFATELVNSEKDHAENVMIVDLLRNDLSRVCEDHSVTVPQLCGLESFATVHHLVSVVKGVLRQPYAAIDLLRATFPGGSITGAPKIRSMEIIAELEAIQRGPYCGSVGYIGFNGDLDTSITIRTFAIQNNIVTFQAGGAVVADSDPTEEYKETLVKSNALRRALTQVIEE